MRHLMGEAVAMLVAALVVTLGLALYSFSPLDPSFNHAVSGNVVGNHVGLFGAYAADFFYQLFGYTAWLWLLLLGAVVYRLARGMTPLLGGWTSLFWLPLVLGLSALMAAHGSWFAGLSPQLPAGAGGALGGMIADALSQPLHALGRDVLLLALILSSFVAASHISLLQVLRRVLLLLGKGRDAMFSATAQLRGSLTGRKERMQAREARAAKKCQTPVKSPKSEPVVAAKAQIKVSKQAHEQQQTELPLDEPAHSGFKLPPLALFSTPDKKRRKHDDASLTATARLLEKKLMDYRVEGEVVAVQPGPVVTQFELEPAPGTKVSRIAALQDDLARSMSAVSVRVAGNIPGKSVIGIEIPNEERDMVFMREVLACPEFSTKKHMLPMALGVDISGHPVVTDLAKMPHLLIAGTTGSGKSVAINTMICSLLMTHTPADLRLIMVDPKMLELSMYDDIPHLLVPVVTNPHKAAKALAWAVYEMERRYRLMSEAKVRNLDGYNKAVSKEKNVERLPFIVIVIDELADLMMVAGKEVEQSICRLAQKARAAGLHLILATQRPSVDVITGLIKANLPCRISFQVSSRIDSRTILDQMGAEQLLGHGDSLFLSGGQNLRRVHGAFISDAEVFGVVEHLKTQGEPEYREEVFEVSEADENAGPDSDETDSKYDEAADLVVQKGQCSVSMVQRYLRVGYNRASRIVEQMERDGLVTPPGSGGMRKVLARSLEDGGGGVG
ncbi:MAG: DNA translocase FtsK 4TM domain-containing protein [Mariprofundaceae bacterium]|nr:DNA translocase FtsK 4TM domain-containing protein [Mariprofundaceae bacterium]